jgi:hypothetical protein
VNTNFTDPEVIGNYIEAGFWILIGLAFLVRNRRLRPPYFALPIGAGITFVLFGCSDVVEAQTGAWWRPWWLLLWKGACLLALAYCYLRYRFLRARHLAAGPAAPLS